MRKVVIIDTSILCVFLQLPTFTSCGGGDDQWDYNRIAQKINQETETGSTLVLPLATIIETGNHISQCSGDRFGLAKKLAKIIMECADSKTPWSAFSEQSHLWDNEQLKRLASDWPDLAGRGISIGDATIIDVAKYYADSGTIVEILTGDSGLRAYTPAPKQPIGSLPVPRRKQ